MSYFEYIYMFKKSQQKDCDFRAFMFDVKNSKTTFTSIENIIKFRKSIKDFYFLLKEEEKVVGRKILLDDEFNKFIFRKDRGMDNNLNNPMILGDSVTFFTYENSISKDRFLNLFCDVINKNNVDFKFHFATGKYETNDYVKGGKMLFKGYMPQILESISKKDDFLIDKNGLGTKEGIEM